MSILSRRKLVNIKCGFGIEFGSTNALKTNDIPMSPLLTTITSLFSQPFPSHAAPNSHRVYRTNTVPQRTGNPLQRRHGIPLTT